MTERVQEEVHCRRCGQLLTSPRAIKKGIGQRCWRAERGLPQIPYRKKNPIDSVPYVYAGDDKYQQMRLSDF